MYLGFVIALLGLSMLLGALSPIFVVAAFFVITERWYIRFEEQAMLRVFGDSYSLYKSKTRRWM